MKNNYDIKTKSEYPKVRILIYIMISFAFTAFISIICLCVFNILLNYEFTIDETNRSDYLAILSTQCSVVFLTTSLMAMLSDRSKYVYWVDLVAKILISPQYMSFLALSVYSLSTILWSFLGFVFCIGPLVIGSFISGIIAITVLFSRMISVYYQHQKHKQKLKKDLLEKMNDEERENILISLKEITFLKAGNREFIDVYDNLALIEEYLLSIDVNNEIHKLQKIFCPVSYGEEIYVSLVLDLAMMYPQEMQEYVDNHTSSNENIRKICYLIYPTILNTYINNGRIDLFEKILCKWSTIENQKNEVKEYISKSVIRHTEIFAEYYSKLFSVFNHQIVISNNYRLYIEILEDLFVNNRDSFKYIIEYNGNREDIYQYCYEKENEHRIDTMVLLADSEECDMDNSFFERTLSTLLDEEIYAYREGSEEDRKTIEEKLVLKKVIELVVKCRTVDEIALFIRQIVNIIQDVDSGVYRNLSNNSDICKYKDFELRALGNALVVAKRYRRGEEIRENRQKLKVLDILLDELEKYYINSI